jgi:hypothetical protein
MHHHVPINGAWIESLPRVISIRRHRPEEGSPRRSPVSRRVEILLDQTNGARMGWNKSNLPAFAVNRQMFDSFAISVVLHSEGAEFSPPNRMKEKHRQNRAITLSF